MDSKETLTQQECLLSDGDLENVGSHIASEANVQDVDGVSAQPPEEDTLPGNKTSDVGHEETNKSSSESDSKGDIDVNSTKVDEDNVTSNVCDKEKTIPKESYKENEPEESEGTINEKCPNKLEPGDSPEEQNVDRTPSGGDTAIYNSEQCHETEGDEALSKLDPEKLSQGQRDELYEQGLHLLKKDKKAVALRCFVHCLSGLDGANGFSFMPQCLRQVADLYYNMGDYEKAVQFIQAEKLYYETAIVQTVKVKTDMKQPAPDEDDATTIAQDKQQPEAVRANEYENLARLCLEKQQPQMALEYQGKATRLRQDVFGETHEATRQSLDFFTVVYGEVGKQQYSESMQKLSSPADHAGDSVQDDQEVRNRKSTKMRTSEDKEKAETRRRENSQAEIKAQEEWISHTLLWVLFFLSFVVLSISATYLYCKIETRSSSCATWRGELYYLYMRIKYFYYYNIAQSSKIYG